MIRIFALLALLVLALPASAMAEDMFKREHDIIRNSGASGDTDYGCSRFSDCGREKSRDTRENAVGETYELGNRFDNEGRGSRRSLSDNVLDQLSPASGR